MVEALLREEASAAQTVQSFLEGAADLAAFTVYCRQHHVARQKKPADVPTNETTAHASREREAASHTRETGEAAAGNTADAGLDQSATVGPCTQLARRE